MLSSTSEALFLRASASFHFLNLHFVVEQVVQISEMPALPLGAVALGCTNICLYKYIFILLYIAKNIYIYVIIHTHTFNVGLDKLQIVIGKFDFSLNVVLIISITITIGMLQKWVLPKTLRYCFCFGFFFFLSFLKLA